MQGGKVKSKDAMLGPACSIPPNPSHSSRFPKSVPCAASLAWLWARWVYQLLLSSTYPLHVGLCPFTLHSKQFTKHFHTITLTTSH